MAPTTISPPLGAQVRLVAKARLRARPLALAGAAIVAAEAAAAALGAPSSLLAALALLVAPGLAMVPLLPDRARRDVVTAVAAAPVLGFAATSVGLITVASSGLALDPVVVRLVPALIVLAGLALRPLEPPLRLARGDALVGAGVLVAVAAGATLEARVLGGSPIPGNDWAKYVLYADEIRRQQALLIDNPFWMLGVPFREDPGVPAVYGAYLLMTGAPAAVLMHGIWAFAVTTVLAVFVMARALWGGPAGVVAAVLWAVLPISQDLLAWHGLPNQAGLALLLLVLLYAGSLLVGGLWPTAAAGAGLVLVALAGTHRLSLLVGVGALALTAGAVFVLGELRRTARAVTWSAAAVVLLGGGVAYDLFQRQRTFGGTLPYTGYLESRFAIGPTARDLTYAFTAAAVVTLVVGVRRAAHDRSVIPVLALLAFTLGCAYAWVVELPLAYMRMAFYLPVALVPLVALALARLPRARATVAGGLALAAVVAAFAWPATGQVRDFYAFVDRGSLRGLDAVAAQLGPREVVVTDRCWSFLATWLLHTRTLPALYPADIQPAAELARARQARAILDGTAQGSALARRLGVRFALVDPTCPDPAGRAMQPPAVGTPAFVSERLVVLRLDRGY